MNLEKNYYSDKHPNIHKLNKHAVSMEDLSCSLIYEKGQNERFIKSILSGFFFASFVNSRKMNFINTSVKNIINAIEMYKGCIR